jgi:hypothetical protein
VATSLRAAGETPWRLGRLVLRSGEAATRYSGRLSAGVDA